MECSWEYDDLTKCGQPADAFRATFVGGTERHFYCRVHLATVRRLSTDEAARAWGWETYTGPIISDQEGALVWFGE